MKIVSLACCLLVAFTFTSCSDADDSTSSDKSKGDILSEIASVLTSLTSKSDAEGAVSKLNGLIDQAKEFKGGLGSLLDGKSIKEKASNATSELGGVAEAGKKIAEQMKRIMGNSDIKSGLGDIVQKIMSLIGK